MLVSISVVGLVGSPPSEVLIQTRVEPLPQQRPPPAVDVVEQTDPENLDLVSGQVLDQAEGAGLRDHGQVLVLVPAETLGPGPAQLQVRDQGELLDVEPGTWFTNRPTPLHDIFIQSSAEKWLFHCFSKNITVKHLQ